MSERKESQPGASTMCRIEPVCKSSWRSSFSVFLGRRRNRARDEDEDDWEKLGVFHDRNRGRRHSRSAWRGEEIEGDDEDAHAD
jgi:hypothetical protein